MRMVKWGGNGKVNQVEPHPSCRVGLGLAAAAFANRA